MEEDAQLSGRQDAGKAAWRPVPRKLAKQMVSRIELAPEVAQAEDRLMEMIEAISVLATNPLIGRPAVNDKRELVIGRGSHGCMALYRYVGRIRPMSVPASAKQSLARPVRERPWPR